MDNLDQPTPNSPATEDGRPGQQVFGQAAPADVPTEGTVVPMADSWAEGVRPVAVAPRGRRLRWGIAVGLVACVALVTTLGVFVISGNAGATKSLTAGHAPKGTIMFMSVRADLPGDQHQKAADLWSHFPGGSDRSQFDNAIDETLNKITRAVSPDLTYTSAFKPWMEGEVSVAVTGAGLSAMGSSSAMMPANPDACASSAPLADSSLDAGAIASLDPFMSSCGFGSMAPMSYAMPQAVVIVALKDHAAAVDWVTAQVAKGSVKFTAQTYAGTQLYTTGTGATSGAYAFTDDALLLGTADAVKASLDAKTKGSLADDANYKTAMNSITGDSIATFYVDYRSMMSAEMSAVPASLSPDMNFMLQAIPAWVAGSVRAESDRIQVEVMMPKPSTAPSIGNKNSVLAAKLPASTIGVMEVHSVGKVVDAGIASLQGPGSTTTYKQEADSISQALKQIGGIDWLGDTSVVVTKNGSTFDGGLVAQATDAATAQAKIDTITNLIALTGSASGLTSHDETYKGTTITVVTYGSGSDAVNLAIAAKDDLIVAGYDKAFVQSVIDTAPGSSLADNADYKAVTADAGASNIESGYIDVASIVDQIGKSAFATDQTRWNLDIKPYLGHLGGAGFSDVDGNPVILRLVITVK